MLGQWLDGCRVLDLFSGTGALGLEALSRGAASLTAVDIDLRWTRKNAEALGMKVDGFELPALKAIELLKKRGATFDVAFSDPPYAMEAAAEILEAVRPIAKIVVLEHGRRETVPKADDTRRFGDTIVSIYR